MPTLAPTYHTGDTARSTVTSATIRLLPVLVVGGWALGLGAAAWAIWAVVVFARLPHVVANGGQAAPAGLKLTVGAIGFIAVVSIVTVDSNAIWSYGIRLSYYLCLAGIVYRSWPMLRDPSARTELVRALARLWKVAIFLGLLGFLVGPLQYTAPLASVLPENLRAYELVSDSLRVRLVDQQDVVTTTSGIRPVAPFTYTNQWGSMVVLLAPCAIVDWRRRYGRLGLRSVLLAVAGVLLVLSLNRSAWLSLLVALAVVAVIRAWKGRASTAVGLAAALIPISAIILNSKLAEIIEERFRAGHSDRNRRTLLGQAWEAALESPFLGYGAPLPNPDSVLRVPVGSHSQYMLVLVSAGFIGLAAYCSFLIYLGVVAARSAVTAPWLLFVTTVVAVQGLFYELLPAQLFCLLLSFAAFSPPDIE
jgi:hypothetical protein